MASPNTTFTEIVTTTLRAHRKQLADNVSNHNALSMRLNARGRKRLEDGGYEIVEPLEYAENSTYQRYSGFDVLNVQASDVFTAAKFDWKQAAVHITASGLELRQNAGKNGMIKLAKSRLNNGIRTFKNNWATDMYSDGTATNQIGGLQALVSDLGTGSPGGIDSSVYSFWLSILQSAAAPIQGGGAITPSATTIQSLMLPLWLRLSRGGDSPDLITADEDYFTFYEESLTDLKRYSADDDPAVGGFVSLKYKTADVIFDSSAGTYSSGHPASHMYMLNTDYLSLVCHRDADMTEVPEQRAINQDAVVIPIITQGNLTVSNRALQGVVKA